MSDIQYGPRRPGYYGAYTNTPEPQSRPFPTETAARALAEKYDVRHLSRNAYSLLLCELRNAGYITTQEFSAGYGGTLPNGVVLEPFPLGIMRRILWSCWGNMKNAVGNFSSFPPGKAWRGSTRGLWRIPIPGCTEYSDRYRTRRPEQSRKPITNRRKYNGSSENKYR